MQARTHTSRQHTSYLRSERDRDFVACFLHGSAQICLCQTPGRRRALITGRFVNTDVTTVQISWRSRWFCRSMSVEDSESRHFELTFGGVFSGRSWPIICPQECFFEFFLIELQFGTCFWKIFLLIASGTKTVWRVSLTFNFVLATSRFHCYRSTMLYV